MLQEKQLLAAACCTTIRNSSYMCNTVVSLWSGCCDDSECFVSSECKYQSDWQGAVWETGGVYYHYIYWCTRV